MYTFEAIGCVESDQYWTDDGKYLPYLRRLYEEMIRRNWTHEGRYSLLIYNPMKENEIDANLSCSEGIDEFHKIHLETGTREYNSGCIIFTTPGLAVRFLEYCSSHKYSCGLRRDDTRNQIKRIWVLSCGFISTDLPNCEDLQREAQNLTPNDGRIPNASWQMRPLRN